MLAAAKSNPEHLFHVQLDKAIRKWQSKIDHPLREDAEDYLVQLERAKKLKFGSKSKQASKIRALEDKLTKYFLRNDVDIVFTTCSSAPHHTLYAGFEPATVFIDEAGQATVAEMCMALDPFKESVKWLTMSGDYNQLMPVVTAKTTNEALHILETSLFHQLLMDDAKRYPHVMLKTQYRSHPDLVDWVNGVFYDGQLISHPSTETITPVAKTIRAFFRQLRGARKNNRNRIAIDVSGEDAASVKYKSTTSYCNHAEARIIVELVKKLLVFRAHRNDKDKGKFADILPRHIGIISGYKGQARLIKSLLLEAGVNLDSVKVFFTEGGDVGTTWAFQGSEVDIAIITLCCRVRGNAAEKLGFIATANALCVQYSRARCFQVTVGNFRGWCEAIIDEKWPKKDHYKAFHSLVKDFHKKGDIVDGEDVKDVLLSDKRPMAPSSNSFYEAIPTLDSKQYTRDNSGASQKSGKFYDKDARKGKNKLQAHDNARLQKALKTNNGMPLNPHAKTGSSNREKKRERQAAMREKKEKEAAEKASLQELLDEGKLPEPVPIISREEDLFSDWADMTTADLTTARAPHERDRMDTSQS